MMKCKLRKLVEMTKALDLGVEFLLLLRFDDVFFIVRSKDYRWEVMTVLRPSKSIENEVVRIVDDVVFRILWEFGLKSLQKSVS